MAQKPPIIVFDLDGTLVDTAADLVNSLNHALAEAGHEPADPLAMRPHVGRGGRAMLDMIGAQRRVDLRRDAIEAMLVSFLEHYAAGIPGRSTLFPGTLEMLSRFSGEGFALAVCTNKYETMATALLKALHVGERFAAICGADTFDFRKPDPRHLMETIRLAGGDPERAVMVGDSRTDIDTAKAAGIPVVAVDFGFSEDHVSVYEPSVVISAMDDLTIELARRLIARSSGVDRPDSRNASR